jgi:hypothetical protein
MSEREYIRASVQRELVPDKDNPEALGKVVERDTVSGELDFRKRKEYFQ